MTYLLKAQVVGSGESVCRRFFLDLLAENLVLGCVFLSPPAFLLRFVLA